MAGQLGKNVLGWSKMPLGNISTLNVLTRVGKYNKLFVQELAYLLSNVSMGLGEVLSINVVVWALGCTPHLWVV